MSVRTPKMPRAAQPTPRGHHDQLSVNSLMRSPPLHPIIASRQASLPQDLSEPPRPRTDTSTPRNMFDGEDRSTIAPTYSSQTVDVSVHSDTRDYRYPSSDPILAPALVPYAGYPHPGQGRHAGTHWRRPRRRRRKREPAPLAAPTCYIFLKALELLSCAAILAVSRVYAGDISLDYLYTVLGVCGLLTAALGLLVIWVKGHPAPDVCAHTTMLVLYCMATPALYCGGIMVALLSDMETIIIVITSLFFGSAFLFSLDMMVMTAALLQCNCCCCCCCNPAFPDHDQRIYPHAASYPGGPGHPHHHHHHPHPHADVLQYSNGHAGYPRSLPQMSVR